LQGELLVLVVLAQSSIPTPACDLLLKTLCKSYKVLTAATKDVRFGSEILVTQLKQLECSSTPSSKFEKLVDLSGVELAPATFTFIQYFQNREVSSRTKVAKESKIIPHLIFTLEKYEVLLIKLCKKSKVTMY
jgi:hypothetical protein